MLHTVGIIKICELLHSRGQLRAGAGIHFDGLLDQVHVDADTAVVYFLIDVVLIPDKIRHREICELLLNRHLDLDVSPVVSFEGFPFFRIIGGKVTGSAALCLCRSAGNGEVFDESLAFIHLLVLEL